MLETVAKNLWLLLTLIVPGTFTYGAWRIFLLLEPSTHLNIELLGQIDSSVIVSASIIIAISLLQQVIAIVIEAVLALLASKKEDKWPNIYTLFHKRFELAATGKLNETASRVIGNFFLSVNMAIGLILLLVYFLLYESMSASEWVPLSIMFLLLATLITIVFRLFNAKWVIEACTKELLAGQADDIKNTRLGLVARLIERHNLYSD